jgi:cell division ATPase FtsA
MRFLQRFQRSQTQAHAAYSLVDVGRDTVKTAVLLKIPGTADVQVVGYGTAETGNHDVTGGRNEAEAVVDAVNIALTRAEDSTEQTIGQKIVPDDVIFAVAGRATVGKLVTVRHTRDRASAPVTEKELNKLRLKAERLLPQALVESAFEGGHWLPLAATDAGLMLDNRYVVGGIGLTGREISLSVFGVAVQVSALRALELLAEALNLNLVNVVAAPHALASVAPQAEGIIMDIGFTGTDICLIRHNALVAADWIPFGGHFFTRALIDGLKITQIEADRLKHAFAAGELDDAQADAVAGHLEKALYRWYRAALEVLRQFAAAGPLPRRIYLTGAASQLAGPDWLLKSDAGLFEAVPEIGYLGQTSLPMVQNLTEAMNYSQMALTLSLSIGVPE